jgi:hypothetical protein
LEANNIICHQNSCPLYIILLKKTDGTHLKMMVNWVIQHVVTDLYPLQLRYLQRSHPNLLPGLEKGCKVRKKSVYLIK